MRLPHLLIIWVIAFRGLSPAATAPPFRALMGFQGWDWVEDTVRLEAKLDLAGKLGYNALIYGFEPPGRINGDSSNNWIHATGKGARWRLATADPGGKVSPRATLINTIARTKRVAEKKGMRFIPHFGPLGWGGTLPDIDPSAQSGEYYELEIPRHPENLFRGGSTGLGGLILKRSGWGDTSGRVMHADPGAPGGPLAKVSMGTEGSYTVHYEISVPWDAYLRCAFEAKRSGPGADSIVLGIYEFNGYRNHPITTKLMARTGRHLGPQAQFLELGFWVRRGGTYFVDLEFRAGTPRGGSWEISNGSLSRGAPPRELLIDTRNREMTSDSDTGPSKGMMARITSLRPPLRNAGFFSLDPVRRDSAWNSMLAFKGSFLDGRPESHRRPVDPSSPATQEIFREVVEVLAEALGGKPEYYHLGGDEIFSLKRSRYQRRGADSALDKPALLARILRNRMDVVSEIFSRKYPAKGGEITFLAYGDMLGWLNGVSEGTKDAALLLAPERIKPRKLVIMPWYYSASMSELTHLYRFLGFSPDAPPIANFERLVHAEAVWLASAGLDFIGLYSTDGRSPGLEAESQGAAVWNRVCGEFRQEKSGRCLGMAYSGWDTDGGRKWGRNYNGLAFLASGWTGKRAAVLDKDGDGEVDFLEKGRFNGFPGSSGPVKTFPDPPR